MIRTVRLYGHLGETFGRVHRFDINTPAEAIRALCANFQGFERYLIERSEPGYRILTGKQERGLDELDAGFSADTIKIVPVVAGAGGDFGKVLLGAALIGASFFLPTAPLLGGFSWAPVVDFSLASIASSIGFSLVLGGVSSMLFSPPKPQQSASEAANNKPSYIFNGAVNTTGQGNPVPICYGEVIVGGQVISTGLGVEQLPV